MNLTNKQKEIINASLDIISQKGIDNLTVATIAKSLNVTEGALYKHFKSKDEIISSIVGFVQQRFLEVTDDIHKSDSIGIKKLKEIFMDRCKLISEHPEQIMIMNSMILFAGNVELNDQIIKSVDSYKKAVMDVIKECQSKKELEPSIDPEHYFSIVTGTLHYFIARWHKNKTHFNLIQEGEKLWYTLENMITCKKRFFS